MLLTLMKEIQLSERMIPRTVCRSGSFNRRTTSRPILSIQLNDCVRFKLQDSSSDSQSNLDQRKEERELPAADQALMGQLSLHNNAQVSSSPPGFADSDRDGLRWRRPCPAAARPLSLRVLIRLILNLCPVRPDRTVRDALASSRRRFPGQWPTE